MARTTKAHIEGSFRTWVHLMDGHIAKSYNDVGGYALDHNTCYGGWRIEQVVNEDGGVREINYGRMSSAQFHQALQFASTSLQELRRNKES